MRKMQRFIRAMKTMLPLRHPNLVTLYGAGKTGPYCWIAMEYVEGESLTQVISRLGTAGMLDWRKALLRIAVYVARAWTTPTASHHSPQTSPPECPGGHSPEITKLGDLMLAKAQEGSLAQEITRPGELLGDIRYIARKDHRRQRHRWPLRPFSLGALVYTLLTGRPPFEGNTH